MFNPTTNFQTNKKEEEENGKSYPMFNIYTYI